MRRSATPTTQSIALALALVLALALALAGCSAERAPTDRPAPALGVPCRVPAGASPRIKEAVPRAGVTCERLPFALSAPRDVLVARDASVFVTEMAAGRVARLADAGFVTVAEGLVGPIGLREGPDGALLVAEEHAQRVSRVDRASGARTTLAEGLGNVTYLALGPDGAAYVSSFTSLDEATGAVKRVPLDGSLPTTVLGGLRVPEGLTFEGAFLVVAEWGTRPSRLVVAEALGTTATLADGFVGLYGVARAPRGDGFLVSDVRADRLAYVHDDGRVEDVVRDLAAPAGIAVTAGGDVYVVEHGDADTHDATGYLVRLTGL